MPTTGFGDRRQSDPKGRYRGRFEQQSKLQLGLSMICSSAAGLWVVACCLMRAHAQWNQAAWHAAVPTVFVLLTVICAASASYFLFRQLSARIATGVGDVEFLDRVRLNVSLMAQIFSGAIMTLALYLARS